MNTKKNLDPQFLAQKTWDLYQTFGVPIEVSEDILFENNLKLDKILLNKLILEHQNLSRESSKGQFKSGLGEDTEKTRKLHTTTHIVHQQLRNLLGDNIKQMGSAITNEKARFDFSFDRKLTQEEIDILTNNVQNIINSNAEMTAIEMPLKEAKKLGAIGLFGEKYGDLVTIYTLKNKNGDIISREFCGGPHIKNTKEIGTFKIIKQKSVGQNLKRLEFDVY